MINKFIKSYLQYKFSTLIAGKKNYEEWKKYNYSLKEVKIKNKRLAKELEEQCNKKDGFLTSAEYFEIDQFGKNGYHTTYSFNGNTTSHKIWKEALPILCQREDYKNIVDVGAGNGKLGAEMLKFAKTHRIDIKWNCVEKNEKLQGEIRNNLKKAKVLDFLANIESNIYKIPLQEKCLAVFSYSLDSIAPEVFINSHQEINFPNAVLGVSVKNGVLKEIVLSKEQLGKRKISFENGIYQNQKGLCFNFKNWLIHPGQRAFIPIASYDFLANIVSFIPESSLIFIIDEFTLVPKSFETNHLCVPKDLGTFTRDVYDLDELYKTSGENLLYFTSYLSEYISVFQALGLTNLSWVEEQAMARKIIENENFNSEYKQNFKCFGLMGIKSKKTKKTIILPGPWKALNILSANH